jgi:hypothetical protein
VGVIGAVLRLLRIFADVRDPGGIPRRMVRRRLIRGVRRLTAPGVTPRPGRKGPK